MKKTKLLALLLTLPLLAGCGETQKEHQHTFAEEWSFNESTHYHEATCEHTDLKSEEGSHNFVNGVCSVCGYEQIIPHTHTFATEWSTNETEHWHAATCEHTDLKSDEGSHNFVNGVCSVCGYEQIIPHTHTFSTDWTSDVTGHWHAATCEHTDLKSGEAAHSYVEGVCSVCGFEDPNYDPFPDDWSETQKQIFKDHLYGYELPYFEGLVIEWDPEELCIVIGGSGVSEETFNEYVNAIVEDGFSKDAGPYPNSFILLKDVVVEGSKKTIEIDIFLSDTTMGVICYDPYLYEWPGDAVSYFIDNHFYVKPKITVPGVEADRYYLETSYLNSNSMLGVYCYSDVNLESSYTTLLIEAGFSVKPKDEYGLLVAKDPLETIRISYNYETEAKVLLIYFEPYGGWPTFAVDYYVNQLRAPESNTTVPSVLGADAYRFYESAFDRYGYFFVACEMKQNYESTYKQLLDEQYEVYDEKINTAGNYFAISDNNDLLVQYKFFTVESISGGEPYSEFDVLFEPYFPHNEEHLAAGFDLIQPGTKTTIPEYPGYGEKITFSDTNQFMTVTIQAAYFDSVETYMNTLVDEYWSVKVVDKTSYQYEAISNDRDIFLKTSMVDGRVTLTFTGYADPEAVWPTEGINEIMTTLGIHGEVPVFEGAFGYDYKNDEIYHDVLCYVPYGKEQQFIDAYYKKLEDLGWRKITSGGSFYYVISGSTVGLYAYTEYVGEGKVFINISYGDGDFYNCDAREAFADWKITLGIDTNVMIPGLNLSSNPVDGTINTDEGVSYPGYNLFEMLFDMGEADVDVIAEEVISQFEKDGWVYSSDDSFYHKQDCFMISHKKNGKLAIDVCAPTPDRSLLGLTKRFVSKLKSPFNTVVLPEALDLSSEHNVYIDTFKIDSLFDLYLYLDFNSASDCKTAMSEIITAFKAVGWTEDKYSDTNDVILIDPQGKLKLELFRFDDSSKELHYEIDENY